LNPGETLAAYARRGIDLWEDGGGLRYRCPEGILTGADRDALALHKPELLAHLSAFRYAPLSRLQEGVWWAQRFQPQAVHQNAADILRLRGSLDRAALEDALGEVVRRHAVLRTTFPEIGGEPVQRIHAPARFHLDYARASESHVREAVSNKCRTPFDLANQFALRATLFRLTEQEHILSLESHIMAIDGWSAGLLRSELFAAYTARVSGAPLALPPVQAHSGVQYGDFAFWQRRGGDEDALRKLLSDWREELEGAELALTWPRGGPDGGPQAGGPGAQERYRLPAEDFNRLKTTARAQSFPVSAVLLAAFCTMLRRATGRRDLVVALPMFERPRVEFEPLIGLFRNAIVLRFDLAEHTSFRETVLHANAVVRRAQERADLPYEKVIAQLPGARAVAAWFNFRNYADAAAPVPVGLVVEQFPVAVPEPPGDLEVNATADSEGLRLSFCYRSDRVSQACVQEMAEGLIRILRQVSVEFDAPVSEPARGTRVGRTPSPARKDPPSPDASACNAASMIRIWEDAMGLDGLTAANDFFGLGGESLQVWQILAGVKRNFGVSVGPGMLLQNPGIAAFAAAVAQSSGRSDPGCVIALQPAGLRPPLFWLNPHSAVHGVAERLGQDRPFLGLYYPAGEFTPPYRMEALAAPLAEQIRRVQEQGPYFLAGWCISGVVAFEVARQLRAQGQEVAFVALFDSFNHGYRPVRHRALMEKIGFHLSTLRRMSLKDSRSYLRERAAGIRRRRLSTTQPPSDIKQAVDIAGRKYEPELCPGRVLLFVPERRLLRAYPDTQGWDKVAPNLELHVVPGDHVAMFLAPNVDVLASKLSASFR
jgi:thioesterase domain-containing protein